MNSFFTSIIKKVIFLVIIFISSVYPQTILFDNLDKVVIASVNNLPIAQQFQTTESLRFITEVELGIYKGGVDGNFTVSIYSTDGDDEANSSLVDIYTGSNSVLSENTSSTFKIDQSNDYNNCLPFELTANTKYWIYVTSEGGDIFIWNYTLDNTGSGAGFLIRNLVEIDYYDSDPMLLKITANNVLPVELNSFTSSVIDNQVKLNWQTATEVNNYGFEVERSLSSHSSSLNGHSLSAEWEMIGFVAGSGNSHSDKEYSFTDKLVSGGKYQYRLKQIDNDGVFSYSNIIEAEVIDIPAEFMLYQNYPNPFNPSTIISFQIPMASNVKLEIFSLVGEKVCELINSNYEAGYYNFGFNSLTFNLSSGTYFYRLTVGEYISIKKLLLVK